MPDRHLAPSHPCLSWRLKRIIPPPFLSTISKTIEIHVRHLSNSRRPPIPHLLIGVGDERLQLLAGSHGSGGVVGGAEVDHVGVRQRLHADRLPVSSQVLVSAQPKEFGPAQRVRPSPKSSAQPKERPIAEWTRKRERARNENIERVRYVWLAILAHASSPLSVPHDQTQVNRHVYEHCALSFDDQTLRSGKKLLLGLQGM